MKEIILTQGMVALVDNTDYKWLTKWKWYAWKHGNMWYAKRNIQTPEKWVSIMMHREILGLKLGDGLIVDHTNRNGLDNRQENLRIVSVADNQHNHGGHKHNTSGYNGVSWHKRDRKFAAYIGVDGVQMRLGYYLNIEDAVKARAQAEEMYW